MKAVKRWTLINALTVARNQYEQDAAFHSAERAAERGETIMPPAARARLTQCFDDQAKAVRELEALLEQEDAVRLED